MKLMAILILLQLNQTTPGPSLSLPSIFSDNMVLQQQVEAPFWGHAKPGKEVIVKTTWGRSVRAYATKDGSWMTKLRTPRAGGPYEVTIRIRRLTNRLQERACRRSVVLFWTIKHGIGAGWRAASHPDQEF